MILFYFIFVLTLTLIIIFFRIDYDSRCIKRQEIVETLEKELPPGTIKYSSRLISIEEFGLYKLLHLADKTIIRTKVINNVFISTV